ncbi:MAG: TetR/AcrR family transcriptional regulator [Magnetococcales bacterium]|nr:TetR/AcrR family transcriptional regulator [Magnetococcales bacterium]
MKDKKTRILEASILLFSQDGFWNTSTASIAKEAGVASGTLFNYFSTKDMLINAVYITLKKDIHASIMATWNPAGNLETKLYHAWLGVVKWALKYPRHYDLLEQLRMSELVTQETREAMTAEFSALHMDVQVGIKEKEIIELPVSYHLAMGGALINATITFLRSQEGGQFDVEELVKQGFLVYWRGVKVK